MKKRYMIVNLFILFVIGFGCQPKQNTKNEQGSSESEYYSEKYRPQFHFSPEANWMNDPNGMVYYEGEYHLFYQYYPDSTVWGPMHWGHAVSTDMLHWEHLPVALFPDEHGFIFSGSAVVDWKDTSGLGKEGQPPLIAIFTYHDMAAQRAGEIDFETQGIAFSNDKGRTWIKYGEPVLKNPGIKDFRDPKVSWHDDIQKWIMTLAVQDHIEFYSSPNLKEWQKESEFGQEKVAHGGVWECPDLFQMDVNGTDEKKWILFVSINPGGPNGGSATQYFVGDFDGSIFTSEQSETKWIDHGRDNYAGVTWSDIPKSDGRRLFLGWMSNWDYANVVPTKKWRSAMTIPRKLVLEKVNNEFVVTSVPVKELEEIRNEKVEVAAQVVSGSLFLKLEGINPMQSEMVFKLELNNDSQFGSPEDFGIVLSNDKGEKFRIIYSAVEKQFLTDRSNGGISTFSDKFAGKSIAPYQAAKEMEIRVFVDEASVEVFVDGGKLVFTDIVFPTEPYNKVKLFSTNGSVKLQKASAWSLNSVW
jgi:fructan beta-fructosidase